MVEDPNCIINRAQYYVPIHPWILGCQAVLTFFVLANFTLATFMDPGIIPQAPADEDRDDDFRAPLYKTTDINGIAVRMKWCVTLLANYNFIRDDDSEVARNGSHACRDRIARTFSSQRASPTMQQRIKALGVPTPLAMTSPVRSFLTDID
ncbi:hypothetical protein HUJ04_003996 [Dendroctonus ponderosae]|nr:hypothetical protein HUJ04_003996 [Dendroctonus ponderosae]